MSLGRAVFFARRVHEQTPVLDVLRAHLCGPFSAPPGAEAAPRHVSYRNPASATVTDPSESLRQRPPAADQRLRIGPDRRLSRSAGFGPLRLFIARRRWEAIFGGQDVRRQFTSRLMQIASVSKAELWPDTTMFLCGVVGPLCRITSCRVSWRRLATRMSPPIRSNKIRTSYSDLSGGTPARMRGAFSVRRRSAPKISAKPDGGRIVFAMALVSVSYFAYGRDSYHELRPSKCPAPQSSG